MAVNGYDGEIDLALKVTADTKSVKSQLSSLSQSIKNLLKVKDSSGKGGSFIDDKDSIKLQKLQNDIESTKLKIQELKEKHDELGTTKIPTAEYKEIQTQITQAENALVRLQERMAKMIEIQGDSARKKSTFKNMEYDAAQLENTIEYAKGELDDLVERGKAFRLGSETTEYKRQENQIESLSIKLRELQGNYSKMGNTARSVLHRYINNAFKDVLNTVKKLGSHVLKLARNHFPLLHRNGKKAGDGLHKSFKKFFKYFLVLGVGVRSFMFLLRKIRSNTIEMMKLLGTQDNGINGEITQLRKSLQSLKGALGTAFQPIFSVINPLLTTFINNLAGALTNIGQLVAALTGQKYIYKATADGLDHTADAANKASKALGKYDDLQVISQETDNSNNTGVTYTKTELSTAISEYAQALKEAWAKADFTEVGTTIGKKLKGAVDTAIDWFKTSGSDFGTKLANSLATFINAVTDVDGLATSIGTLIATAFNTVLNSLNTFLTEVKFDQVGTFIADGLTALLVDNELLNNIATAAANLLNAGFSLLGGFSESFDWVGLGIAVKTSIQDFLDTFKWKEAGISIASFVSGLAEFLLNAFGDMSTWENLGQKIADGINAFAKKMNKKDVWDSVNKKWISGWTALGRTLSSLVDGFVTTFTTVITSISWTDIIGGITDVLSGISTETWLTFLAIGSLPKLKSAFTSTLKSGIGSKIALGALTLTMTIAAFQRLDDSSTVTDKIMAAVFAGVAGYSISNGNPYISLGSLVIGFAISFDLFNPEGGPNKAIKDFFRNTADWLNNADWTEAWKEAYKSIDWLSFTTSMFEEAGKSFSAIGDINWSWGTLGGNLLELGGYIVDGIGEGIVGAFSSILEPIGKFFVYVYNGICNSFGIHSPAKTMKPIGKNIILGIGEGFSNAFSSIWQGIKDFFSWIIEKFKSVFGIHSPAKTTEDIGKNIILGIGEGISNAFSGVGQSVSGFCSNLLSKIKAPFKNVGAWFSEKFSGVWSNIKSPFSGANGTFSDILDKIKSPFKNIGGWFSTKFSGVWSNIKSPFSGADSIFGDIVDKIKSPFKSIAKWFKETFSDAWEKVKGVFSSGGKIFDGIKSGILNGFKSVVNKLILGINTIVKKPFEGINTAIDKIRDVSIMGYTPFSKLGEITIPQIPYLAKGAVIPPNKEFLAVLGDQKSGTNIETPLATMIDAFNTALDGRGGAGDNRPIILQVGSRTLAELVWDEERKYYKQTGRPSPVY